jgi:predicted transglutaminase-like cysteine proteinase
VKVVHVRLEFGEERARTLRRVGAHVLATVFVLGLPFSATAQQTGALSRECSAPGLLERAEWHGWVVRGRLCSGTIAAVAEHPKEVCAFVEKYIRYRSDRNDEWQTPEQTLRRRAGDCEDFAILIQDICERMGYPSSVYLLFGENRERDGHAIVAGQLLSGGWWFADNGSYGEVGTFKELRVRVAERMGWDPAGTWYVKLDRRQIAARLAHRSSSCDDVAFRVNAR